MTKKTTTINLKGKEYATVPARLAEFRKDNPNGLIETIPTISDNKIMFKARILKNKAEPNSGEATGHSMVDGKGEKVFEKAETIAVGRALALLGYLASGEIASGEEMEEFMDYKETQRQEKVAELLEQAEQIKTKEELRSFYQLNKGYGKDFDAKMIELSKNLK